jgi:hypothetical protein
MNVIPRSVVWPGQMPTNNNGTPRPLLKANRPYFTIHYTGGGLWLDPDDTIEEMRSIQQFAAGPSKQTPWEYNWVIDGQGNVGEYAGDYQAAHSGGENDTAIGVILLVGFKGTYPNAVEYWEDPTPQMIAAVQELRVWLESTGRLAETHSMLPHQQMPGAATACPGVAVMNHWDQLCAYPTPTPPPSEDPEMYLATLNDGTVVVVGSAVRPVSGDEIIPGGPLADLPRYVPKPDSYWHQWLKGGVAEYSSRVQPIA